MFENKYDQVICKNVHELIYVNNVAVKLGKSGLDSCIPTLKKYPINIFLHGDHVGWTDSHDRIGNKFSFTEFVKWEQEIQHDNK